MRPRFSFCGDSLHDEHTYAPLPFCLPLESTTTPASGCATTRRRSRFATLRPHETHVLRGMCLRFTTDGAPHTLLPTDRRFGTKKQANVAF